MFLLFSTEARTLASSTPKPALANALRIAWNRLGPDSEYEMHGRTMRHGCIEVQDIKAALAANQ